ncbi:MAG TPA: response regulator [Candidatus Kapabacteria bacterium]
MFRESEKDQEFVSSDVRSSKNLGGILLIVEDYEKMRLFFARHFEKNGYRVYSAARIGDAERLAHSVLPSVILIDYHLEHENAYEAVKILHSVVPGARIVVFGGIESDEIRSQIIAISGVDLVPHGYDIEKLDSILS